MAERIDISAVARVVDQASAPLRAISSTIKGVGDVAKQASGALANLASRASFGNLASSARNVGSALGKLAGNFKALASPIGAFIGIAGVTGAVAAMRDFMSTARQIQKMSTATGASPEMIQTWRHLAGNVETADRSLTFLAKNLANLATKGGKSGKEIINVLGKMGISMADIRSGAITMDEILPKLAAGFAKNTNESSRAAVAQALFGKAWKDMVPILAQGPEAIEVAWQQLQKFGYITREQIADAVQARTVWREFDLALSGLKNTIVSALLPAVTPMIGATRDWLVQMRDPAASTFKTVVTALGSAIGTLWKGVEKVVSVMGGWENASLAVGALFAVKLLPDIAKLTQAFAGLGAAAVFNPLTIGAIGLAGAAVAVRKNWDTVGPWLQQQFASLSPEAQQAFTAISKWGLDSYKAILAGWKSGGLVGAVTAGVGAAGKAIYDNWDEIKAWAGRAFPELTNAAVRAWSGIVTWWQTSVASIKSAWESGGLGAALEATWDAIKTGAQNIVGALKNIDWASVGSWAKSAIEGAWMTYFAVGEWMRNQIANVDWAGVGTMAGNLFKSAWQLTLNLLEWLKSLDWETIGFEIGQALGQAVKGAWTLLVNIGQWIRDTNWLDVGKAILDGFMSLAGTFVNIGARLAGSIVEGLFGRLPETVRNFLGLRDGGAGAAAAATAPAAAMAQQAADTVGNVVPFPGARAAAAPATTMPLATTPGPSVAQPSLLQQMQQIPVRLDGEVNIRQRVDMSPDLRAMLTDIKSTNRLLKAQLDVGVSMGPAMGEAA